MSTSDILCITNRHLCGRDFLSRIREIAACRPAGIILREKDLSPEAYEELASAVLDICRDAEVPCILHSHIDMARCLKADGIHLPMPLLLQADTGLHESFSLLGASCHSTEEALLAQQLGCSYITAGHIFDTNCKKGLPGRGTDFLKEICRSVSIPVYGLGGITPDNADMVRACGSAGICIMSSAMTCPDVPSYFRSISSGGSHGIIS